ncbi:MAG TPA: exodeoxyribonuclease VII large subunit [Candidatus Fimimorpha faecalis]|uniref:Exodeoxyribonuclease 7 large subunit n=1 Tax=Candidatus Fimimorpha faecalis TaxID=2840824 RepID=A0A9D1EFP1_9FIRM|nr:exodeoxyribonuclease VII large subunit [Candidatus Fimimorpha faecalis]
MASIYSVRQVNAYIKNMFTQDFVLNKMKIKGEVSNCKYHTSGHIYFTLKDETSTLACVMFYKNRSGLNFHLQEGQKVICSGMINVYERDGRYQLYVNQVEQDGAGDLYQRFQELKLRLEEMGMFAEQYKQPIPRYAKSIGIVTAATGAAIHDIIQIATRRNPYVQLYLQPALVQGDGAAESIVHGIQVLDRMNLDCMIVGRGGGSIEDLWAFNEEIVARAIFECETPIISAVGHEVDVTIADFVADLRAPTPSAAAELAVFDYRLLDGVLEEIKQRMELSINQRLQLEKHRLEKELLRLRLLHPGNQLLQKKQCLSKLQGELQRSMEYYLEKNRHRLELIGKRLQGASPLNKLTGGYAYLSDQEGDPIESIDQIQIGETIFLRLKDGRVQTSVLKKEQIRYDDR